MLIFDTGARFLWVTYQPVFQSTSKRHYKINKPPKKVGPYFFGGFSLSHSCLESRIGFKFVNVAFYFFVRKITFLPVLIML